MQDVLVGKVVYTRVLAWLHGYQYGSWVEFDFKSNCGTTDSVMKRALAKNLVGFKLLTLSTRTAWFNVYYFKERLFWCHVIMLNSDNCSWVLFWEDQA